LIQEELTVPSKGEGGKGDSGGTLGFAEDQLIEFLEKCWGKEPGLDKGLRSQEKGELKKKSSH